jgi:GrpB-like predicted nucleotidyltransferase (UPF0157 family)
MRLIGAHEIDPIEDDYRLIGALFRRLPREAAHTGSLSRFVGFDSTVPGGRRLRFLGIEVGEIEGIPEGLWGWELAERSWTIRQSRGGRDEPVWEEGISWQWLDRPASGRWSGEYLARGPTAWWGAEQAEPRPFLMWGHAYIAPCGGAADDDVQLLPYDPAWPERFREMEAWLRSRLGPLAPRIEHYGSTAVPGLPAKPVVDILVEVPSFAEARGRVIPLLNDECWEYWWYSDHMTFVKRLSLMGPRTHHVHMAPRGHEVWRGIAFRDYLRSHPRDAERYADLKRRLAAAHRADRERYTREKTWLVREITAAAEARRPAAP